MATLDEDVQAATTVINDLVSALAAATGSENGGVPAADQTALETAIAAGQAAVAPAAVAPAEVPAAPVSDPAVA